MNRNLTNHMILLGKLLSVVLSDCSQALSIDSNSDNINNKTCHLCNEIVDIIDAELNIANASIVIIEDIIKLFCHTIIIPTQKKECYDIVNNISNIINWLLDGLTPHEICQKIGFC